MPTPAERSAIWWVRRDFRVHDNPVITKAQKNHLNVVPVVIADDTSWFTGNDPRSRIFQESLARLIEEVRKYGGSVLVRAGEPIQELADILASTQSSVVYSLQPDDDKSKKLFRRAESKFQLLPIKDESRRYSKCTDSLPTGNFRRFFSAWQSIPLGEDNPGNTKSIVFRSLQRNQRSIPITNTPDRLSILKRDFFSNRGLLTNYSSKKDRVDITTTSRLSPFITNGVLSQSDLFKAAKISVEKNPTMAESAKEYERQIAWRDYFSTILYKTPEIELRTLDASLFGIPWVNHEDDYSRWVNGETGYPIVDSAMRQLATEGWIHNRLRMIVASFLVKHLLVDWRIGMLHFQSTLVDHDTAANSGNWQWIAGTAPFSAPYFRIFNPVIQGVKCDPHGSYVRRWVPELTNVPDKYIHSPWSYRKKTTMYPTPIIDHMTARERALKTFKTARILPAN